MTYIQTTFQIDSKSRISSFISWKKFRNDIEFIEVVEDYLFWKYMIESDKWDFISKEDVFNTLDYCIWK
jgi:hypothetical protein